MPKAIATNAEPPNVEMVLREAGLARFFRYTVDGHQVANPKPHPDVYLRAAELLGVPPANCVVFEDSHGGEWLPVWRRACESVISTMFAELPGVSLLVKDFNVPALEAWLRQ